MESSEVKIIWVASEIEELKQKYKIACRSHFFLFIGIKW